MMMMNTVDRLGHRASVDLLRRACAHSGVK